jgi:hypothetical protein
MKRKHLNLLLGALALGLAVTVYFSREKPEPPPPPLTSLNTNDINRILIRHGGRKDIRLEKRKNGDWWLATPVETRAEAVEVGAILGLAERASQRRYPVAEMDLAGIDLDPSGWSVQLNDVRIEFGSLDPIEARRYARLGDTVHLIEDPPSAALDAEYHDLVARRLLPENAAITRIALPDFTLSRSGKAGWTVTPAAADRGADAAQQLADTWQQAQAMWITMLDSNKRAQGQVEIRAGDERFQFTILDRKDQLVLARPELGVQYTLSKTLDSDLFELKPPAKEDTESDDTGPHPSPLPEGEGAGSSPLPLGEGAERSEAGEG